jgi:hypothetical protein
MRVSLCVLALAVVAGGWLVGTPTAAGEKSDFLKPDNWVGLMEYWKIEGTTVTGTSPKEGLKFNTFLVSKQKYGDFEFKCQVRTRGEGSPNSGFQFRSILDDMKKFGVRGPQADIGEGWWGSLYGERFNPKDGGPSGAIMKKAPDTVAKTIKKDDFNDYRLKVVGKHVTITVNGVTAVDDDFPVMPETGVFAFQLHAGKFMEVVFRNIEFTDLSQAKQ